jgi:phage terminase large subunit-like protein
MSAGRPAKPVELHKLHGTYRKDRHGAKETRPKASRRAKAVPVREMPSSWPPIRLAAVPQSEIDAGDGAKYIQFIAKHCRLTNESVAGKVGDPMVLRRWQRELITRLFARRPDGHLRHRQALVGMGRKNGKSCLTAGIGLADLILGPGGGEIYSCAAEREQARIVWGTAKKMIALDPWLSERLRVYRDFIENIETGSIYRVLSAEAYSKEGLNPHRVIFDEVHAQPTRELWDTMALAMGSRPDPLMIGITTPGVRSDAFGRDSLCFELYKYGCEVAAGQITDPSFFFAWWEPENPESDYRLESTWREGNPGYGDLNDPEDFRVTVLKTPESEFRIKRCSQWVASSQAFLPFGAWDLCAERRPIPAGAEVILGVDASQTQDSTGIVAIEVGARHVDVVGIWERPAWADNSWSVPILDVKAAIAAACSHWKVSAIMFDPHGIRDTMQSLSEQGLPVVEFPQSVERLIQGTSLIFEGVMHRTLSHSGDPRLAAHVANCVLKIEQRGARIVKRSEKSAAKIDLAAAMLFALWQLNKEPPKAEPGVYYAFA